MFNGHIGNLLVKRPLAVGVGVGVGVSGEAGRPRLVRFPLEVWPFLENGRRQQLFPHPPPPKKKGKNPAVHERGTQKTIISALDTRIFGGPKTSLVSVRP